MCIFNLVTRFEFWRFQKIGRNLKVRKTILIFLIVGVSLTGCTTVIKKDADAGLVLTATTESTLPVYHLGLPIKNKQEAISAALANLEKSRLRYQHVPEVVSVEKMNVEDARRQFKERDITIFGGRTAGTLVWVVLFEGEWQIIPPNPSHTETPPPFTHGCVYVIMDASDGGEAEVGGIECSP